MRLRTCALVRISAVMALLGVSAMLATRLSEASRDKNVWNYDGGLVVITNGSLPNGVCFRLAGKVTAPGFFDGLRRIDTHEGATFKRHSEMVTQFPDRVFVIFVIHDHYDQTCPPREENAGPQYLTRAMMSSLQLYLYWKHGVELRPIDKVESKYFSVSPIIPYAAAQAHDLPDKFEWAYELAVPSAGVPLTDSLVLILRTADGHIAARVAARL